MAMRRLQGTIGRRKTETDEPEAQHATRPPPHMVVPPDDRALGAVEAAGSERPGSHDAVAGSFHTIVSRFLSPEGLLVGITFTPSMRDEKT